MNTANNPIDDASEKPEPRPPFKLDLSYFTEINRCPLMVRRGARHAFELFMFLADRCLASHGDPVIAEHEALCAACGLKPDNPYSGSAISRLLRSLRETYGVIDFRPVQRRRPEIRLAPARPGADILNPPHYIYFSDGWSGQQRTIFDALGTRAFCAEYMFWIAKYEASLAQVKHHRSYWFFPQDKISKMYHVSTPFAGMGLRGLVELGIMRVTPGQYRLTAPHDEFGPANRYYFEGVREVARRREQFKIVQGQYEAVFKIAHDLAAELINGSTIKNVQGLCKLMVEYGEKRVRQAVSQIADTPPRSLKRRIEYVRAVVGGAK